jgi:hypothetical protein
MVSVWRERHLLLVLVPWCTSAATGENPREVAVRFPSIDLIRERHFRGKDRT